MFEVLIPKTFNKSRQSENICCAFWFYSLFTEGRSPIKKAFWGLICFFIPLAHIETDRWSDGKQLYHILLFYFQVDSIADELEGYTTIKTRSTHCNSIVPGFK